MLRKKDYPAAVKYKRRMYELHLTPLILEGDKPDTNARGFFQASNGVKRIVLDKKLSRKELFETFLHEAIHLIEHAEGISIPHRVIEEIEGPLAQLLFDNFELRFKAK